MRDSMSCVDLHALQAFVAVCETKSMTEAARVLGVTQSAVSQLIATLEREQGVLLFDREFRPVRPNAAGKMLFEQAEGLLEHARSVSLSVRLTANASVSSLRFGCVDSYAAAVGPHLVQRLAEKVRDLSLWSGLTPILAEQLIGRELDLAVCTEAAFDARRIAVRPLFSERFVAVAPKRTGSEPRRSDFISALRDLPFLRYTSRSVIGQQIERFITHMNIDPPKRFEFDDTDPLLGLVASGLGCAITTPMCLWQSRAHLEHIEVVPLPATNLGNRHFFLMTRQGEWSGIVDAIADESVDIVRNTVSPSLEHALPNLPQRLFDSYAPTSNQDSAAKNQSL
ncbi:LysR family transcriptional regulator [Burkholderia ambifaria]|uniref:LysR family transcriptional regulator n=1 Tax=Burkholderia ambifaria TaxID=152480 RepID=UPI001B9EC1DB|nr:LysR family transcriptional regulator [Burkholderia ambifaria]MBR8184199.1 LysR family transcriptional regulator [Burkholderia ambifaria]